MGRPSVHWPPMVTGWGPPQRFRDDAVLSSGKKCIHYDPLYALEAFHPLTNKTSTWKETTEGEKVCPILKQVTNQQINRQKPFKTDKAYSDNPFPKTLWEWEKNLFYKVRPSEIQRSCSGQPIMLKTLWKKEKILVFITMFSKDFFINVVKSRECVVKG